MGTWKSHCMQYWLIHISGVRDALGALRDFSVRGPQLKADVNDKIDIKKDVQLKF